MEPPAIRVWAANAVYVGTDDGIRSDMTLLLPG